MALEDRISTRRLQDRAAFALQAAVELNGTRRSQVEELLAKRLQAKEMSPALFLSRPSEIGFESNPEKADFRRAEISGNI